MGRIYRTDHGMSREGGVVPRFGEEHLFTSLVFKLWLKLDKGHKEEEIFVWGIQPWV